MSETLDIIAIGESLIELSTEKSLTMTSTLDKYYGGDTLTTAIAALRSGAKVGFISRIGLDGFKDYLLESWQEEGLDISRVKPVEGGNGLYVISKSDDGSSKSFSYYRKKTAATNLCADDISSDYISSASIVYSTGITQSLSLSAREAVLKAFKIAKENNVMTVYDPNYTPKIWSWQEAREVFDELSDYIDVIILNVDYDAESISDAESADNIIKALCDKGISTVVLKSTKDKGYYVSGMGKTEFIEFYEQEPVDTTGSGDAFNGGVLYGLSSGMNIFKAVKYGAVVAGLQIKKFGAIKSIPYKDEIMPIFKGDNE